MFAIPWPSDGTLLLRCQGLLWGVYLRKRLAILSCFRGIVCDGCVDMVIQVYGENRRRFTRRPYLKILINFQSSLIHIRITIKQQSKWVNPLSLLTIPKDNTDPSFENRILQLRSHREGGEGNSHKMNQIIILHCCIIPQEEDCGYVNECEDEHAPINLIREDTEQHEEDDRQVAGMPDTLTHLGEVGVTEGTYQQHPLIQKFRDCPSIPPILVKDSASQLGQFRHRQQDVLHDQVVETDVYVEGRRDQSEEQLKERHRAVCLRLKQGTNDLRKQDVIDEEAHHGHCHLDQEVRNVDPEFRNVLYDEFVVDYLRGDDKLEQKEEVPPSFYPFRMDFLMMIPRSRGQLVNTEASSLDRQRPTNHNYEDTIRKVKLQSVDSIESDGHKHPQPHQTVAVNPPPRHHPQKQEDQVHLEEAQDRKAGDDCEIFNEIGSDGLEDVPLEDVALVDEVGDDVHETEVDAGFEEQALEAEEF